MKRRALLSGMATAGLGLALLRYWPEDGLLNPCLAGELPPTLREHPRLIAALEGLRGTELWDCHVHLIGTGDGGQGIWVHPDMADVRHPMRFAQYRFYLNAACAPSKDVDVFYPQHLARLQQALPAGARLMLLAFDHYHDEQGRRQESLSTFHTPNALAAAVAQRYPDSFEWIASVHPYREDCVAALDAAVAQGARAVKWLPPGMGMDPASPLCDRFYAAMARHDIPLLVHGGDEHAVQAAGTQHLGNPLKLRRPLQQGVRVIVAHCASLGSSIDLDKGEQGPRLPSFDLFSRMMDEAEFQGRLFGEISALTQVNRSDRVLRQVLQRDDWHPRLINGSDFPLPGILPLFSLKTFRRRGYLDAPQVELLIQVRRYNPLLFDLLLKRMLVIDGASLGTEVFASRRLFS